MRKVKTRWRPLTSNIFDGRKQFSYHFPANPSFANGRYQTEQVISVRKTIGLFFELRSKYEISGHSLKLRVNRADKTSRKRLELMSILASLFELEFSLQICMELTVKTIKFLFFRQTKTSAHRKEQNGNYRQ